MSTSTGFPPRSATRWAVASPIPCAPPVMAIVRSESDMGLQRARAGAFSPVSESALLASAAIEYPDVEYLIGKLPTEESCAHQFHSDNHQACDLEWSRLPGQQIGRASCRERVCQYG